MPTGTALALLLGPVMVARLGWPAWWWLLAGFTLLMAAWAWHRIPADPAPTGDVRPAAGGGWRLDAAAAPDVGRPQPWLVALAFAVYAASGWP